MPTEATEHPTTGVDISSAAFWARPLVERDESFAWLRANAPISWHPPIESAAELGFTRTGFWAITRAADITSVSMHHDVFSSVFRRNLDNELNDPNFLGMDPPDHTRYRNMISAAFTPKGVARLREKLGERSAALVDAVAGTGEFDFVEKISSQLPMMTIADMVGVDERDVPAFTDAGNDLMAATIADQELPEGMTVMDVALKATTTLHDIGNDLVRHRREHPGDDIATALARAEIDGRPLDESEVTGFIVLLAAAGNDTTKHTSSWTALNFCENPDQRAWLSQDYEGRIAQSIEEFVRHATVVGSFSRWAMADTEIAGQPIAEGEVVTLFYYSGNRDETLFTDPHRFDLARPRANHVAFGGRGVHFCLGNVLAKASLRALFAEVLTKMPDLELAGEPRLMNSEFINGIRHLPVASN